MVTTALLLDQATNQPIPDLMEVRFLWSTKHGFCEDCGLPAAFYSLRYKGDDEGKLCSVCAAGDAVDGMSIRRIEEL